jgi:RNA polymerase sigma-70 factor (ECF subfamily)
MNIDIEKIRSGDIEEFERLYRLYCKDLILFAYKYVYDLAMAENIVQDVFLNVWINRTDLDPRKNTKTYLYTAVRNNALNIIKHSKIERQYKELFLVQDKQEQSPESELLLKELQSSVNHAIKSLPQKCRTIFLMSRNDHLTYSEIASILGLSPKTIENQIAKALKRLHKALAKIEVTPL